MQKSSSVVAIYLGILCISGCSPRNHYEDISDRDLEKMADRRDLEDRYNLYYEVYYSRTPRRPTLAPKLAEFKEKATSLAVKRAQNGPKELLAALPVIQSVNIIYDIPCTTEQHDMLISVANANGFGQTVRNQIEDSCALR